MADNYLEKKMEDLRSGRLTQSTGKRLTSQKGMWCVDFPCRRVLVTDGTGATGRSVVTEFCRAGCKVAFFAGDAAAGKDVAGTTGARFVHCVVADMDSVKMAVDGLVKAWRDIDIIVNTASEPADALLGILASHRDRLPYPNDFGGRLIDVIPTGSGGSKEIEGIAAKYGITVNRVITAEGCVPVQTVAKLCVFLSAPGSEFIDGADIAVGSRDD